MLWTVAFIVHFVVATPVALTILLRGGAPRATLAWIMGVLFLPGLGLFLFLVIGEPRRGWHRVRRRRRRRRLRASGRLRGPTGSTDEVGQAGHDALDRLAILARRLRACPATSDNDVVLYHDSDQTFLALQIAIEAAESHVHLEYYIFQPDATGEVFRDLLIRKARQGVECRLLLDYVGCWNIPRSFLRPMKEAGVQVAFAMPVVPWRGRWRANFRNHRKIVVIDGKIGFTGSQNIGDEYRGRYAELGPWRDTHMKIIGPAALHLQEVFAEDWHYTVRESLAGRRYFPRTAPAGRHRVQIVPSGPDQRAHVMHQLLFAAVSAARSSISVITPYFVPDETMLLALESAAYRGVHVRLLIPSRTDQRFVLWAGRSFYEQLIRSGVEIYEHDEAMLHSKVMVVDRAWAMAGSANMDERSFRLSFELTAILYSRDLGEELYHHFELLRVRSRQTRVRDVAGRPLGEALLLGLARLASPLL